MGGFKTLLNAYRMHPETPQINGTKKKRNYRSIEYYSCPFSRLDTKWYVSGSCVEQTWRPRGNTCAHLNTYSRLGSTHTAQMCRNVHKTKPCRSQFHVYFFPFSPHFLSSQKSTPYATSNRAIHLPRHLALGDRKTHTIKLSHTYHIFYNRSILFHGKPQCFRRPDCGQE